jgi:hypothetical protein
MNHGEPTFIVRAGRRSLLIAIGASVAGLLSVATGLLSLRSGNGGMGGVAMGLVSLVLGCYLLVVNMSARMIVSPTGLEVSSPFRNRRLKELPWREVSSIKVSPTRTYVVFQGASGVRINVGPGAVHWEELLDLASAHLAPELSAVLQPFRRR